MMEIQARYTDPKLSEVRDYVSSKYSKTPILLLPVRIETRFMKMERSDPSFSDAGVVGTILEDIHRIERDFLDYPKTPNARALKRLLQALSQTNKQLRTTVNKMGQITKAQKTLLEDALSSAVKNAQQMEVKLSKSDDSMKFKAELKTLSSLGKRIDASAPSKTEAMLDFAKGMTALEQKLAVFSNQKVPFTTHRKKKQLYGFVSGRISEVKRFYENSQKEVLSIWSAEANQIQKIKELHKKIKGHLENLERYIKPIHDDENWRNFVDAQIHLIRNEYGALFENFEKNVFTHLDEVQKMDVVDANEFLVHCLSVKRLIHTIASAPSISYGKIKLFRKQLKGQMDRLESLKTKILIGDESQKLQLFRLLGEVETERSKLDRKFAGLTFQKGSQQFGLKTTRSFLAKTGKMTFLNNSNIRMTNRQVISEAKYTAIAASKNLQQFEAALEGNTMINETQNALLSDVLRNAQVALRKEYLFTENDLGRLNRAFKQVREKGGGAQFESPQIEQAYTNKMAALEQTLEQLQGQVMIVGKQNGIQFIAPQQLHDELWLRIYPDDIFVQTHEKSMTRGELDSATRYWKIVWAVDSDKNLILGAWRSMVASYGSTRAAWIVQTVGAQKKPISDDILLNNPSKAMVDANGQLSAVQQILQPSESATTLQELEEQEIDFAAVKAQLDAVETTYKQLHDQPQLIYFLEKAISVQQRIHTILQRLGDLTQRHPITGRDGPIIDGIRTVFHSFEALHVAFKALKAMRTDQFLEYLPEPYNYPNHQVLQAKAESWTVAPHTRVLPKQFIAVGRNKGLFEIIHVGNPIPESLQLGMDPATFNFDTESNNPFQIDENGDLRVDEGMRWMVDFSEAVKKGMGMIIPLTIEQAQKGFDELYVIGLNDQSALEDVAELEALLENHHYAPTGMEFLKIGTPTNNTEAAKTGYNERGMDADSAYALEMEGPLFDTNVDTLDHPFDTPDGRHLARLLGISDTTFTHIKNSDLNQIGRARAMHKSLWHATLGVYMEDMWDKVFTYDNIERTYQFFTNHVVGRGYLPSLRVGSQPYGILPVTSFKKIAFSSHFSEETLPVLSEDELRNPTSDTLQKHLQFRYDVRLKKLLNQGHRIWTFLRDKYVNHAGNITSKEDPQAAFIDMLGLNATSVEHYFRYGVNVNDRTTENLTDVGINFKNEEDVLYSPHSLILNFSQLLKGGYYRPSFEWDDETDPSVDMFKQETRQNSRIKDQVENSRIFAYRYFNRHSLVGGDLVSPVLNDQPLPLIGESKNYIQWLLDPSKHLYHDIFNDNDVANLPSQSILFLLLRQSMLLSYRQAALNILQKDGFFKESFRRVLGAKESYMSRDLYHFRTKWSHLLKRIGDIKEGFYFDDQDITQKPLYRFLTSGRNESVSDYVHRASFRNGYSGHAAHQEFIDRNEEVKDAIRHLENVATDELQKLLAEHLDVSSYRLDAWLSGFANKRLEESRALQEKGIFLGAYAWVTDLRPGGKRKEVSTIPRGMAKDGDTVFTDEDNEGYIHAPSINHAISAAVLRSGYLANNDSDGELSNRMAVNLSSARVRKAMQIIDGLKNGLDLASILGYQFEKGLHERYEEAELDKFIYPLRKRFPLIVPLEVTTEAARQHTANVVHGVDLLESITDAIDDQPGVSQNSLYEYLVGNNFERCPAWLIEFVETHGSTDHAERNSELTALIKEIDRMADAFDALGDLAISESVYQIVNGNHVRAAAMLTALGDGKRMPEPQIIDTPRTGTVVTHRVILHMEDNNGKPTGWVDAAWTPRALAEPSINHWLAGKIGDPESYYCQVNVVGDQDTFRLQLHELPLQPLDLLFLLSNNKEEGNADLMDLIKDTVRYREGLASEMVLGVAITAKNETWPGDARTFYELDWLLHQCKSILHDARPIGFSDVYLPSESPSADNPNGYDLADTKRRVGEIFGGLKACISRIKEFLSDNPTLENRNSFNIAYQLLLDAAQYGITNLLADLNRRSDAEEAVILLERLQKVLDLLEKRDLEASELLAKSNQAVSTHQQVQELTKVAKKVLGEDFPFLPVFSNAIRSEFEQQFGLSESDSLLRASTSKFPIDEWMQGISEVRSKMYALEMLHMFEVHSNQGGTPVTGPLPVQFPYNEGDYWLGMAFPDEFDAREDRLSLFLLNPTFAVRNEKQKGILIDEWVEVIPNKKETTGVAFQYDQPDARPPQTILLAVSPKPVTGTSKWDWDDLVYTLMDTLEMAQNRIVEPDHLEQSVLGQVLPAIISEVVPPQIRSVFNPDDADIYQNPLGVQVVLDYEVNLPKKEEED